MSLKSASQLIAALAAAGWGFVPAGFAFAQGCSMCYNDAAAQNAAGVRALQHGILALLIPSLVLFAAVFAIAYRRRNQFNDRAAGAKEEVSAEASSRSKG